MTWRHLVYFCMVTAGYSQPFDPWQLPIWNDSLIANDSVILSPEPITDSMDLETEGSKRIRISVGDEGADVRQELRLSISGEPSPGVFLDARLTDVGREPGQQATATLQEVDQILVQVKGEYGEVQLGDVHMAQEHMWLFGLQRSGVGLVIAPQSPWASGSAATVSGETESVRSVFRGVNGQRKGYVVTIASGSFPTVVPNSEQVWINGKKLQRHTDYNFEPAGGVIDFVGSILPSSEDEIQVEFEVFEPLAMQVSNAVDAKGQGAIGALDWSFAVAAHRSGSDLARLRSTLWTQEELTLLQNDLGSDLGDSSWAVRPTKAEATGVRLGLGLNRRSKGELEWAWHGLDTNALSPFVAGPQGKALAWTFTLDSTKAAQGFQLGWSGGAWQKDFQPEPGTKRFWDSWELRERWDLDSAVSMQSRRLDLVDLGWIFPFGWKSGLHWGSRRGNDWQSQRMGATLDHFSQNAQGRMDQYSQSHIGTWMVETDSSQRWQGEAEGRMVVGAWTPFGALDHSVWNRSGNLSQRSNSTTGMQWRRPDGLVEAQGELFVDLAQRQTLDHWQDSLRTRRWTQTAFWKGQGWSLDHLLQGTSSWGQESGQSMAWLTEQSLQWGDGRASYQLGLTQEQSLVPLYRKVPEGTGDVLFDSVSGVFVEGVDRGDYVYEGLVRSDSSGLVESAQTGLEMQGHLPLSLLVKRGILADMHLRWEGQWQRRDTAQGISWRPPLLPSELDNAVDGVSRTRLEPSWEKSVHAVVGVWEVFKEKRSGSLGATEENVLLQMQYTWTGRAREIWVTEFDRGISRLQALDTLRWETRSLRGSWNRNWAWGGEMEPEARYKWLLGTDALLRESALTLRYRRGPNASVRSRFSTVYAQLGAIAIPYQASEGYGEGWTRRLETNVQWENEKTLRFALGWVLRQEESIPGVFQKFSLESEARF